MSIGVPSGYTPPIDPTVLEKQKEAIEKNERYAEKAFHRKVVQAEWNPGRLELHGISHDKLPKCLQTLTEAIDFGYDQAFTLKFLRNRLMHCRHAALALRYRVIELTLCLQPYLDCYAEVEEYKRQGKQDKQQKAKEKLAEAEKILIRSMYCSALLDDNYILSQPFPLYNIRFSGTFYDLLRESIKEFKQSEEKEEDPPADNNGRQSQPYGCPLLQNSMAMLKVQKRHDGYVKAVKTDKVEKVVDTPSGRRVLAGH